MKILICLLSMGISAFGFEISSVKVSGDNQALVRFMGSGGKPSSPALKVIGNTVELSFPNTSLSSVHQGKLDVGSPHALIHRVSLFESDSKQLKAIVVINGSIDGLKNRISVVESGEGLSLRVDYPKVGNSTLELLKEEQMPLQDLGKDSKKEARGMPWFQVVLFLLVVCGAGVATYFVVRFTKSKGAWGGSRKYLVEQLSYVPIGGMKSGVALVKVGGDFVLLGVTPNQVSFLSHLPKLSQQYEEENQFEKNTFNEAVQEQLRGKSLNI